MNDHLVLTFYEAPWVGVYASIAPKSGDTTNIVWNVVDKSLSTLFKKSAMRARFGQSIVQTLSIALAMKVMYSAMIYMYNAIKVIDNAIKVIDKGMIFFLKGTSLLPYPFI